MIRERLEAKTYLHSGLTIVFVDETSRRRTIEFDHDGGIAEFLPSWSPSAARRRRAPQRRSTSSARRERRPPRGWRCSGPRRPTSTSARTSTASRPPTGGTHENGLARRSSRRSATTSRRTSSTPKGVTLTAEDIREGLVGVLSIYVHEPQFQGQTKDRLNNPEVAGAGRRRRPPGARAAGCNENKTAGRGDRRAHHPGGARARGVARGVARRSSRKTAVSTG